MSNASWPLKSLTLRWTAQPGGLYHILTTAVKKAEGPSTTQAKGALLWVTDKKNACLDGQASKSLNLRKSRMAPYHTTLTALIQMRFDLGQKAIFGHIAGNALHNLTTFE